MSAFTRVLALAAALLVPSGAGAGEFDRSLAGDLLVADPSMPDGRFSGTVIYMCEHSAEGALGLVINQEIAAVPSAVLAEEFKLEVEPGDRSIRLLWGGPVELNRGFVLHSTDTMAAHSLAVEDGIALSSDPDLLADIVAGGGPSRALLALGYAGWGPGQLERELDRFGWVVVPAGPEFVFRDDIADMWQAALDLLGLEL